MNLQSINNITYEIVKRNKEIFLIPIKGVHSEETVNDAKITLDAKYLDFDVHISWQEN